MGCPVGPDPMEDHENQDPGREGFRQPGEVKTPVRGSAAGAKGGFKSRGGGTPRKRLDEATLMETSLMEKATSGLRHALETRMGPVGSTRVSGQVGMSWVLETWVASKALGLVGLGELFSSLGTVPVCWCPCEAWCRGYVRRRWTDEPLQQARVWSKALLLPS